LLSKETKITWNKSNQQTTCNSSLNNITRTKQRNSNDDARTIISVQSHNTSSQQQEQQRAHKSSGTRTVQHELQKSTSIDMVPKAETCRLQCQHAADNSQLQKWTMQSPKHRKHSTQPQNLMCTSRRRDEVVPQFSNGPTKIDTWIEQFNDDAISCRIGTNRNENAANDFDSQPCSQNSCNRNMNLRRRQSLQNGRPSVRMPSPSRSLVRPGESSVFRKARSCRTFSVTSSCCTSVVKNTVPDNKMYEDDITTQSKLELASADKYDVTDCHHQPAKRRESESFCGRNDGTENLMMRPEAFTSQNELFAANDGVHVDEPLHGIPSVILFPAITRPGAEDKNVIYFQA
jgi:hypothetical protein